MTCGTADHDLMEIWCDLGGKPSGAATARFLRAASKPVMGSAVPTFTSVHAEPSPERDGQDGGLNRAR